MNGSEQEDTHMSMDVNTDIQRAICDSKIKNNTNLCTLKDLVSVFYGYLSEKEIVEIVFEHVHCANCGSQRCEGIHSEWFSGCKFKEQFDRLMAD